MDWSDFHKSTDVGSGMVRVLDLTCLGYYCQLGTRPCPVQYIPGLPGLVRPMLSGFGWLDVQNRLALRAPETQDRLQVCDSVRL